MKKKKKQKKEKILFKFMKFSNVSIEVNSLTIL